MKFLMLMLGLLMPVAQAADTSAVPIEAQLTQVLADLDREAQAGDYAAMERLQSRQALDRLLAARSRDRDNALDEAQVLLQIADFSVKAAQLKEQLVQLQRERDGIIVEASRRDAQLARKEAENLRLQALAREEEQATANAGLNSELLISKSSADSATDDQAKRLADARAREAELARLEEELSEQVTATEDNLLISRSVAGKSMYVLSAAAFEPGKSVLTAQAKALLMQLSRKLKSSGKTYAIEGHTDATGVESDNLSLSKKRAEAVLNALKAAGISKAKLSAKGLGSSKPVASNQSKKGRAQNRRVEIVQK